MPQTQDIDLYEKNPAEYDRIQNLRPDYKQAVEKTVQYVAGHITKLAPISVADFCGGTGKGVLLLGTSRDGTTGISLGVGPPTISVSRPIIL